MSRFARQRRHQASNGAPKRSAAPGKGMGSTTGMGICHSYTPDGRCVSLLKILLTNFCLYDCLYCINRRSSDIPRARFSVQEVVDLTLSFYRRNYIEGLFLSELYVTNAVKHFKWQPRGKRRLHKRPDASEVAACNHWLDAEVSQVKPRIIVALGASALRAVAGLTDSIESARLLHIPHASGAQVVCTYHPSAILRADPANADQLRSHLVDDLRRARELVA